MHTTIQQLTVFILFILNSSLSFAENAPVAENAPTFVPTTLENLTEAQQVFDSLNATHFHEKSQCYQRAHVWAKNLDENRAIKSEKIFLLFTRRYQRMHRTLWAYHVAPMIPVKTPTGTQDYVFDKTYLSETGGEDNDESTFPERPVPVSEWAEIFVGPYHCPWINTYAEFLANTDQGDCYLLRTSMYDYSIFSIQNASDMPSEKRSDWNADDLSDMRGALRRRYRN